MHFEQVLGSAFLGPPLFQHSWWAAYAAVAWNKQAWTLNVLWSLSVCTQDKPHWSPSDLCAPTGHSQMSGSCSMSWLNIPVYRVLLRCTAEGSSSWNIWEHTGKTRALKVSSHRQGFLLSLGLKEKSRGLSQIPLELSVSGEVNCAWEAFLHCLWRNDLLPVR